MFHFFHQYREVTPLNTDSHQCSGPKYVFGLIFILQYETIWVGRQYSWFKSPWKWVCCRRPKQAGRSTAGRLNSTFLSDRLLHLKRFSQISLVQCFINGEDCKVRITWGNKKMDALTLDLSWGPSRTTRPQRLFCFWCLYNVWWCFN